MRYDFADSRTASSLPLLVVPWLIYLNHRYILANPALPSYLPTFLRTLLAQILGRPDPSAPFSWSILPAGTRNPVEPFLFLSGAVQKSSASAVGKVGEGAVLAGETLYKRDLKVSLVSGGWGWADTPSRISCSFRTSSSSFPCTSDSTD